jgi:hypothetical protein
MPRWNPVPVLALAALICPAARVSATEQEEDLIKHEGKTACLLECPLNQHLRKMKPVPRFDPPRTSNWKGYTVDWEIRDSHLYLTAFSATQAGKAVPISALFPGRELPLPRTGSRARCTSSAPNANVWTDTRRSNTSRK